MNTLTTMKNSKNIVKHQFILLFVTRRVELNEKTRPHYFPSSYSDQELGMLTIPVCAHSTVSNHTLP